MSDKVFVCKTERARIEEDEVKAHHRAGHAIRQVFPGEKVFLREVALMPHVSPPLNADPNCKACHGTGKVSDFVPRPFGPGNVRMESTCECVEER